MIYFTTSQLHRFILAQTHNIVQITPRVKMDDIYTHYGTN